MKEGSRFGLKRDKPRLKSCRTTSAAAAYTVDREPEYNRKKGIPYDAVTTQKRRNR